MNLHVFDTDHVTLHQHNHPQVIAKLQTCAPENAAVTVVPVQEHKRGRLAQTRPTERILPGQQRRASG